ncbi:hypothetical protein [Paludifilum halophilum]|uniref:Peptidase MA-like domain-containing protein n=1 Tax=Paludifilum halophilum TaxID=1642702 RepID=A0A235B319_9BACL|nr:hypothetical protein [Paludifilum halophilum]OYD06706.1 hypothetical protein CHM34_14080 [Paludifilum halophilum]
MWVSKAARRILSVGMVLLVCTGAWVPYFVHAEVQPVKEEIRQLIREKQEAVNRKDREHFLRLINPSMPAYVQEQKRWFDDAVRWIDPYSYRLRLISVIPEKEHQIRAWVEQTYCRRGKEYSVKFPLSFQETASGWKDSDLPFYHLTRGNAVVHFSDKILREQASIALNTVVKASRELERIYGWRTRHRLEVKLYSRPEVFRQSVKLSLPSWAAGWHEEDQAIKMVGAKGFSDKKLFSSGIVHEITHQMVSELTGDNAAYWMQEGAAEYYQSHLLPGLRTEEEDKPYGKPRWKMSQMEELDLEKLPRQAAEEYYDQCEHWYRFLVRRYGEEKLKRVFELLELYPAIDRDSSEKRTELNQRTRSALRKVLGKTLEQLEREWMEDRKKKQKTGD